MRKCNAEINALLWPWIIGVPVLVVYHVQIAKHEPVAPVIIPSAAASAAAIAATGYELLPITDIKSPKREQKYSGDMANWMNYFSAHH